EASRGRGAPTGEERRTEAARSKRGPCDLAGARAGMNTNLSRDPLSRPGEPTDAPPGSLRKIRVLTERASRREALFHPQDNLKRRLPMPTAEADEAPELEPVLEDDLDLEEADDEPLEVEADLAG